MKNILMAIILGFSFSTTVFAASDDELIQTCLADAKKRFSQQAAILGCTTDVEEVEASGVDNRWYNPSKYIWYVAVLECPNTQPYEVEKMIQYYDGKCI